MPTKALMRTNRTGISTAPDLAAEMQEAPAEFPPSSPGDAQGIAAVRLVYAKDAEPPGTMPAPPNLKETARKAVKAVQGKQPNLFLDKLGERLAFERAGTRLYEALLSKFDAYGSFSGGPSRGDLEHIFSEEQQHVLLLKHAIEELGGDPTAVTPSANLHAVISMGLPQVLTDARTDLVQCLEAVLVAELADNTCWQALSDLAEMAGEEELVQQFGEALQHEQEHLDNVLSWIAAAQGRAGGRSSSHTLAATKRLAPHPNRAPRKAVKKRRSAADSITKSRRRS